ncbi:MAG: cation-transporting P-type ATPase [Candidatus Pacearchaeota archaeon]
MEKRGLSEREVKERREKYGFNEIRDSSKTSITKIILRQIKSNFVIYLLTFSMILSFIIGKYITAYVVLMVIIIVIGTGFIQEYKAEKAIQALKEMLMPVSIVIREGKEREIPSRELVPEDIIILRSGERVPADCIVLEEKNFLVNESILTGESKELKKKPIKSLDRYSDENTIFMGSFVVSGKCVARVIKIGMNTKFGKIANLISETEKEMPLQKKVNKIAKYMVILGATFSVITGIIILLKSQTINYNLLMEVLIIVIAVSVASFPEGFPVVLTTALSVGAYRMAKKNAIVNRMSIIETLGETTVICSDKTGTITKGEMTVKKIFTDNREIEVSGAGYEGTGDFFEDGKKINIEKEKTLKELIKAGVLCNDAKIERTGEDNFFHIIGTPTEASLLILGAKAKIFKEDLKVERKDEIPFSSERKMMTVLVEENGKKTIYSKGAIEIIIERCSQIQRDNGIFRIRESDKRRILEANKELTSKAFRTIALAYRKIEINSLDKFEENLIFLGIVGIEDPPREGVKEAIEICRQAGIKVKMITGDNKETALNIANQISLDEGRILEGYEIDRLSDDELRIVVKETTIFARVNPEHKLRIVRALKENGDIVTMTGDGVNDAPALKEAHIGVAMGKNGTDVSRSVADLTLKDDNFVTIVDAIKEGRTIFTNIQKFSSYQISINLSQVAIIFFATVIGLPIPLLAIQILFMNLFSDELTAITLAFNPYSGDSMSHKPRKKSIIITKPILLMLSIAGLTMSVGSLIVFNYLLKNGTDIETARTITFLTMVFFGITNAFNFRSFRKLTLTRNPFTNKPLVYVSIITIITSILIIYSPLREIIEVTPVPPIFILISLTISLSVIVIFDTIKAINEKYRIWSEDMQELNKKN